MIPYGPKTLAILCQGGRVPRPVVDAILAALLNAALANPTEPGEMLADWPDAPDQTRPGVEGDAASTHYLTWAEYHGFLASPATLRPQRRRLVEIFRSEFGRGWLPQEVPGREELLWEWRWLLRLGAPAPAGPQAAGSNQPDRCPRLCRPQGPTPAASPAPVFMTAATTASTIRPMTVGRPVMARSAQHRRGPDPRHSCTRPADHVLLGTLSEQEQLHLQGFPGVQIVGAQEDFIWLARAVRAGAVPTEHLPGLEGLPVMTLPLTLALTERHTGKIEALERAIELGRSEIQTLVSCYRRKSENLDERLPLARHTLSGVNLDSNRLVAAVLARRRKQRCQGAPCQGVDFPWVRFPPGNCRSSR